MKTKKIFLPLALLIFVPLFIKASTLLGVNDEFFWVGNNSYLSGDSGDPSIGMIKLSGSSYGVTLEDEINGTGKRVLTGSAWIGVGSANDTVGSFSPDQGDHPSLGWLRFDQGVPTNCTNLDPTDTNGCHPVTWNRRNGAPSSSLEGYLSGWAKFDIGKDALGNAYPETWVHFKTPSNTTNFACDGSAPARGNSYYTCTDSAGAFYGYAWSSGLTSVLKTDNPGFGWLGFTRAGSITAQVDESTEAPASNCYILNNLSANSICGSPGSPTTVNLFANFIDGGVNQNDYDYKWSCDGSETYETGTQTHECTYAPTVQTTYVPTLMVKQKSASGWNACASSTSIIKYYTGKTCQVEVREVKEDNTGNSFSTTGTIYIEKEMEARVTRQCVKGGTVTWTQPQNGKILSYPTSSTMKATFNPAGDGIVGATLKNVIGGGDVTCNAAELRVRDKVKWGL